MNLNLNSLIAEKFKNVDFTSEQLAMFSETILMNNEAKGLLSTIKEHSTLLDESNQGIKRTMLFEESKLKQYTFETAINILLGATLIYQVIKGQGGQIIYQLTIRGAQLLIYMTENDLL